MGNKPNVLILFTDQQRYDTIQIAGYPHMITPNLDRLAADGCIYTHAYSSNPVCMAARHDLLTGLPARAHGYYQNHRNQPIKDYNMPTVARIFSENGYRTAAIGKMHFQPSRMHHGYSELILMEEIPRRRQDDQYATFLKGEGLGSVQNIHGVRANLYLTPQNSQMDEEHHPNHWVADRTVEWLEHNQDNPFFLFCSWIHPHPPWATPVEFQGLYKDKNIPLPSQVARSFPFPEERSEWHGDDDTPEEIRSAREAYYSCITHVDHHIGRILDYLEAKQMLDNTLIIFTSDHGEMLYDRGMHHKALPYDGAARIPFIVRYPEKAAKGTTSADFVDLMDILPTCLDACGLQHPASDYSPIGDSVFAEQPRRSRELQTSCFGMGVNRWVMTRDHRYKYVYYYKRGTEELFDMQQDPQELNNLLANKNDPVPQQVYQHLKSAAIEFERQWGPEELIVNETFIEIKDNGKASRGAALHGNNQFQFMDNREPRERGEQFIRECEYAIKAEGNHGKQLTDVFNDPQYIKKFMEQWKEFTGSTVVPEQLFKTGGQHE